MTTFIETRVEYRLVLRGPAVSFRSAYSGAYRERVRAEARGLFQKPLSAETVDVWIDYFHTKPRRVDMDNVAKLVLDALNGVAYIDDRRVRLRGAKPYWLRFPVSIPRGPIDLIKPLANHEEYLFVRISGYDR